MRQGQFVGRDSAVLCGNARTGRGGEGAPEVRSGAQRADGEGRVDTASRGCEEALQRSGPGFTGGWGGSHIGGSERKDSAELGGEGRA